MQGSAEFDRLNAMLAFLDTSFFGIARWADFHRAVDRRDYPGLHRLFETLKDDPAARFALAVEHGEQAESSGGFAGQVSLEEALAMMKAAA